ncbi:hypothetical protein P9112_013873 [Eukaryota sp. TZLM1-RC]
MLSFFSSSVSQSRYSMDSAEIHNTKVLACCTSTHIVLMNSTTSKVLSVYDTNLPTSVPHEEILIPSVENHLHSVKFIRQEPTALPFLLVGLPDGTVLLLKVENDFSICKVSSLTLPEQSPVQVSGVVTSSGQNDTSFAVIASTSLCCYLLAFSISLEIISKLDFPNHLITNSLVFSNNNASFLVISDTSGQVNIYDLSFELITSLKSITSTPSILTYYTSSETSFLAVGGSCGKLCVYSVFNSSFSPISILNPFKKSIVGLNFVSNHLVCLCSDSAIIVYRYHSNKPWEVVSQSKSSVDDVMALGMIGVDPDMVAVNYRDGGLALLQITGQKTDNLIENLIERPIKGGHFGPVTSCQWYQNSRLLLTSGADHVIRLWGEINGEIFEVSRPLIHGHVITRTFFDFSCPLRLCVCSAENCIRVLDVTRVVEEIITQNLGLSLPSPDANRPPRYDAAELQDLGLTTQAVKKDLTTVDCIRNHSTPTEKELKSETFWVEVSRIPGRATADVSVACQLAQKGIIFVGHNDGFVSLHRLGSHAVSGDDRYFLIGDGRLSRDVIREVAVCDSFGLIISPDFKVFLVNFELIDGFLTDTVDSDCSASMTFEEVSIDLDSVDSKVACAKPFGNCFLITLGHKVVFFDPKSRQVVSILTLDHVITALSTCNHFFFLGTDSGFVIVGNYQTDLNVGEIIKVNSVYLTCLDVFNSDSYFNIAFTGVNGVVGTFKYGNDVSNQIHYSLNN